MSDKILRGPQIVLALDSILFLAFGLLYMVVPELMAGQVGIQMKTAGAMIDLQGLYGGLEAGLGAYLGLCALKQTRHQNGLLVGSFALSGIALARILATIRLGLPDPGVLGLLALDVFGATMNLYFLKKLSR